jgi:uncharacterized protein (DUF983 family)
MVRPTIPTMLWRGARRRCAWCGGRGAFFRGWFAKEDRCRTCGISWQRGYEGFELGAMTISAIVCLGTLIVTLVIAIVVTWPDLPVVPLLAILGVGALALPVLMYPISYTLWQGIDLAMHPPTEGDDAPTPVHWSFRPGKNVPDP